jgi:hypothetical protein
MHPGPTERSQRGLRSVRISFQIALPHKQPQALHLTLTFNRGSQRFPGN